MADALIGIDDGVTTRGEQVAQNINVLGEEIMTQPVQTIGDILGAAKGDLDNLMFEGGARERPEAVMGYAAAPMTPVIARMISGANDARNLASRTDKLYNFPTKSEVGDALGRSHTGGLDLEGRPLVAQHVVGGAPERVREQSLPSEAIAEIGKRFTRDGFAAVPKVTGGGRDSGAVLFPAHAGMICPAG